MLKDKEQIITNFSPKCVANKSKPPFLEYQFLLNTL